MSIHANIPTKSMRSKLSGPLKMELRELFLLAQLCGFHFLCCMTEYGYNVNLRMSVPTLRFYIKLWKEGSNLLESIFDPKTQYKTIVPLGMEEYLLQLWL